MTNDKSDWSLVSGHWSRRLRRLFLLALRPFLGVLLLGDLAARGLERGGLLGVDGGPVGPLAGHVGLGEDGLDRALRHARLAVDAVGRVDVQHLLVLVETLHRADGYAVGVL